MNHLRLGRFSLLFATLGLVAVATTFFVPTLFVLSGLFAAIVLVLGLLGIRSRAGRIGLSLALLALPCITLFSHRLGFEARTRVAVPQAPPLTADVYFSPHGGCTDAIISQIVAAKRSVLVQAYWLTSAPIAQALVEAHRRGVSVQVVLDKSQETARYSGATFLYNNGIEPLIDRTHAIAHNKVIIVDSAVVITGSMNFTRAGESKNAENVLILREVALAARYTENWNEHANHSRPYRSDDQAKAMTALPTYGEEPVPEQTVAVP